MSYLFWRGISLLTFACTLLACTGFPPAAQAQHFPSQRPGQPVPVSRRGALALRKNVSRAATAGPAVTVAALQQEHPSAPLELTYRLRLTRPAAHLVDVEIEAGKVTEPSIDFVTPAWAPGRYAIYDFAKNVQEFAASGAQGQPLAWEKLDKQTWRVDARQAAEPNCDSMMREKRLGAI